VIDELARATAVSREQIDRFESRIAINDDADLEALAELGHETERARVGLNQVEYQARKRATRCNASRT
jgi:2-phospho-L-lactate guanylyltransferase (CobY/MobA/RfbA family)